MKIYPLNSVAFNGTLRVDPNCKFADNEAIKRFGTYIEQNTSPSLDVFIKNMPEREAGHVQTLKYAPGYAEQRRKDKVNEKWLNEGGNAADIPGGYPNFGPGPTSYTATETENLKIEYKSPNTWAVSGFYLDTEGNNSSEDTLGYLVQNLKTNAAGDINE